MKYNTKTIRNLINEAFNSDDLEIFCSDYFEKVSEEFTTGQNKGKRIEHLIDYVKRNGLFDTLLRRIKEENPYQYSRYASQLMTQDESYQSTPHNAATNTQTKGIPQPLMTPLREALMDCDEFFSPRQLRAVFDTDPLRLWKSGLPGGDAVDERVDLTIEYLLPKNTVSGENGLISLLQILAHRYQKEDSQYYRLTELAEQLKDSIQH